MTGQDDSDAKEDNHNLHKPPSNDYNDTRELRRAKGIIACAECRRAKLKCDRQIPCSSCVRRGCPSVCPNGIQTPSERNRHGTKNAMADAQLHTKVAEMSSHIQKLEDALRISHSYHSASQHPLLSDELLVIKKGLTRDNCGPLGPVSTLSDEQFIELFGTLTVNERGTERFVGASGTTENLLLSELEHESADIPFPHHPPARTSLVHLSQDNRDWIFAPHYPDFKHDEGRLLQVIAKHLPSRERGVALCEAYLTNLSWFVRPVDREQLLEELLPDVYEKLIESPGSLFSLSCHSSPHGSNTDSDEWDLEDEIDMDLHEVSLLLAAFAAGAAADFTLPAYNDEAEMYRELAMVAMSLKPVLDSDGNSLAVVQAITLLGAYHMFSGRVNSLEHVWKVQSFACILATGIGLHRDPANWHLDPKQIQRRRQVFWEVYGIDHWKSLACGRPMSFHWSAVDCEFPEDTDAVVDSYGNVIPSSWDWKRRFNKQVVSKITSKLCSSQVIKFSDVLELDRKIRDFDDRVLLPDTNSHLHNVTVGNPTPGQQGDTPQLIAIHIYKDIALLFIHRGFFAEAIIKNPTNPLESPFASSFLAAYRSATRMLDIFRAKFDMLSHLLLRMWAFWAHALSAAVMIGSVALHCPTSRVAKSALIELDYAIELFEKATLHPVVKSGLPILHRLREKAQEIARRAKPRSNKSNLLYQDKQQSPGGTSPTTETYSADDEEGQNELAILRGRTRYVRRSSLHSSTRKSKGLHQRTTSGHSVYSSGSDPSHHDLASVGEQSMGNTSGPDVGNEGRQSPFQAFFQQTGGLTESMFTVHHDPAPSDLLAPVPQQANGTGGVVSVGAGVGVVDGTGSATGAPSDVPAPNPPLQVQLPADPSSSSMDLQSDYSLNLLMNQRNGFMGFDYAVPPLGMDGIASTSDALDTTTSYDSSMQDVFDTAQPEEAWRTFMQDSGIEGLDKLEFGTWKWDF